MEQVRSRGSALKLALALTCVVLVVELAGGLISHSLALLSDAGHVLTDVFALGLAWFAVAQARSVPDRIPWQGRLGHRPHCRRVEEEPSMLVTRPRASSTINEPAATSHARSPNSQNPSVRPAAT